MNKNWPAYSLIFAAFMWGFLWYPVRIFREAGMSGLWASLIMFISAILVGFVLMRGHWQELKGHPKRLLGIALASGWCNAAFIVAIAEKDAARVVLLFYLSPVWTILLGMLVLHERPQRSVLYVCIVAFFGAMLMLWNPAEGFPWPRDWVDWLAISSGVSFAIMNVLIRDLQQVSVTSKAFISWIGVLVIAIPWLLFDFMLQSPEITNFLPVTSLSIWLACIALGVFGIVSMTLSVQYGVTKLPVYKSSIILLAEVAVTVITTQLLSDEILSTMAWIGGTLIVGASLMFALASEHES